MTFNVAPEMYDRFMGRYGDALGRALSERAGVRPGMRALDVGAGTGKLTAVLTEILGEENVAAVDPSEPFASALAEQFPAADVRRGTAEELPFEDGSFDAVFAQLVVNFLTDPEGGAAEMARVAKEGGRRCGGGLGLPWRDDHAEGVLGGGGRGRRARRSGSRRAHADALWRAGGGRAALGRSRPSRRRGRRDRRLRVLRGLRRSLGALPRRSRARRRLHCLARAGRAGSPAGGVPAPPRLCPRGPSSSRPGRGTRSGRGNRRSARRRREPPLRVAEGRCPLSGRGARRACASRARGGFRARPRRGQGGRRPRSPVRRSRRRERGARAHRRAGRRASSRRDRRLRRPPDRHAARLRPSSSYAWPTRSRATTLPCRRRGRFPARTGSPLCPCSRHGLPRASSRSTARSRSYRCASWRPRRKSSGT